MGINQSSDVAQAAMDDLFRHFAAVEIYHDDIGVFNTSWAEQFVSLTKVLAVLNRHDFTVNPRKCEWEPDRLGYLLTPTGFKPWKKIQVILALESPQTVMQLRSFIGTVTSYVSRNDHTHILAPLTTLVGGRGTVKRTADCQKAFDQVKAILATDAFLQYPDHNTPFHCYSQ
jgi:hypothetical protein